MMTFGDGRWFGEKTKSLTFPTQSILLNSTRQKDPRGCRRAKTLEKIDLLDPLFPDPYVHTSTQNRQEFTSSQRPFKRFFLRKHPKSEVLSQLHSGIFAGWGEEKLSILVRKIPGENPVAWFIISHTRLQMDWPVSRAVAKLAELLETKITSIFGRKKAQKILFLPTDIFWLQSLACCETLGISPEERKKEAPEKEDSMMIMTFLHTFAMFWQARRLMPTKNRWTFWMIVSWKREKNWKIAKDGGPIFSPRLRKEKNASFYLETAMLCSLDLALHGPNQFSFWINAKRDDDRDEQKSIWRMEKCSSHLYEIVALTY